MSLIIWLAAVIPSKQMQVWSYIHTQARVKLQSKGCYPDITNAAMSALNEFNHVVRVMGRFFNPKGLALIEMN